MPGVKTAASPVQDKKHTKRSTTGRRIPCKLYVLQKTRALFLHVPPADHLGKKIGVTGPHEGRGAASSAFRKEETPSPQRGGRANAHPLYRKRERKKRVSLISGKEAKDRKKIILKSPQEIERVRKRKRALVGSRRETERPRPQRGKNVFCREALLDKRGRRSRWLGGAEIGLG